MSTLAASPASLSWLALGVVLAAVFLAALVVRATGRSSRGSVRRRTAELLQALTGRLAGRVPVQALREAAREIEAEQFWSALEAITSTLRRRERLELARSLARNRHVVAERRALRGDDAPARRELAARRLALLPSARLRPTLRRALVTGPEPVRLAAARGLALLRDVPALGWICSHPSALATRPLPAVSGLLRAFGPGARTWLIAALDRGIAQPRFECAVLDALGISRCRSARERIQSRLHSRERDVRVAAARSLGRLGMGEAIPSLIPALADPAWPVRAQAASALGRLRAAPAADALAGCVTDPAWWVRHHAAYALASIGPEGRDLLCELVLRSPDPFAREMAREALDQAVSRETA